MWQYNPLTRNFDKVGLVNVAPLCTIETEGWTGSTSGEVLFTGDGTTVDFSGKVDLPPINPLNSFTLHYVIGGNSYSVTADEDGNLSDANMTGTINQDGTYEFHFNTAPDNETDGTADYNYGIAPTNFENAFDMDRSNYSSEGWTSSSSAGYVSYVNFEMPDEGAYLCCFELEVKTTGSGEKVRVGGYSKCDGSLWTLTDSTFLDGGQFGTDYYRRGNIRPIFVTGKYARLGFYLTAAGTFWIRFRYIGIFRLI